MNIHFEVTKIMYRSTYIYKYRNHKCLTCCTEQPTYVPSYPFSQIPSHANMAGQFVHCNGGHGGSNVDWG